MTKLPNVLGLLLLSHGLCLPAAGQAFQDLSTTADGSILYFSSPVRQKNTDQKFYSKIFRWTAAEAVKLVAEVRDPGPADNCGPSQFYQLSRPQVSADGTVFGYTASRPVEVNRYCSPAEPNQSIVAQLGRTARLDGNLALSPNGRYAITTTFVGLLDDFHAVTDLPNGLPLIVAGAFNGSSRRVTNEGTILTPKPSAVILTDRTGLTRVLPSKWAVDDAIIDPAATRVVYVTRLGPNSPARLSVINVQTGNESELITGFAITNPLISADGSTILYTSAGSGPLQLFSIAIDGSNRRQLTHEKDAIVSAVVAGNGLVAFAVTSTSRLLRIDVASGATSELVAATPLIIAANRASAPTTSIAAAGSLMQIAASGLDGSAQLSLCGRPVTLTQHLTRFQVPFDLPEGTCSLVVSSGSPFESGIDLEVKQYDPQFAGTLLFLHGDFKGLVSPIAPAKAGEVIVAYMSGLGPVDPSGLVAAGFQCRFDAVPAEVQYAGLAPGFTGFYQVNVRVPSPAPLSSTATCGFDSSRQASASVWLAH